MGDLLRNYKIKNVNNLVIGSLNINSIRNKFDQLKLLVNNNVDILIIEGKKLMRPFQLGNLICQVMVHPLEKI